MRASGKWKVNSIPSHVGEHNEAVLATGQLHEMGLLDIPKRPPCLKEGSEDLQDIEVSSRNSLNLGILPTQEMGFRV